MPQMQRARAVWRCLRAMRFDLCAHRSCESIFRTLRRGARAQNHNALFFPPSDSQCQRFLRRWVAQLAQTEARNKLREWLGEAGASNLIDWDISRDAPYFGFEIPGAPGKYFYVWLDAPVGYYASLKALCNARGLDFEDWVKPE